MALGEHFLNFKEHPKASAISLSILDTFADLKEKEIDFIDKEALDVHLVKHRLEWDENLETWFSFLLNKQKNSFEISFSNFLLTTGLREKFLKLRIQNELASLKSLYDLMIFIEKQTEFSLFEHIEVIFPVEELAQIYKLFFFHLFRQLPSENKFSSSLSIESYQIVKDLKVQTDELYNNTFYFLENILEHIQHIEYVIKYFLKFSNDKYIFYFLINHKKLSSTQLHIMLLEQDLNENLNFVSYLILFNQYLKLEDNLVEYIKNSPIEIFYSLLRAIILRFDFYKLNSENGYLFYLILTDLLQKPVDFLKKLVTYIDPIDYILFSPVIVYVISSLPEEDEQTQILLSTVVSILDASELLNNQKLSTSIYPLLNYFLDFLKDKKNLHERLLNLITGRFHSYLFPKEKKFSELEIQTFFILSNLFIYKFHEVLDAESIKKIFKMNLKLFEKYLKESTPDLFQLNLFKIYIGFLNNTLKEHEITEEMFSGFIEKINSVFYENDLIKYQALLLMISNKDQIVNVNEMDLDILGESTRKRLVEFTGITRRKIIIYPIFESSGIQLSTFSFKLLIFLKIFILYDIFYPLTKYLSNSTLEFKRDQNKIYMFEKENQIRNEYDLNEIKITQIRFFYHYVNLFSAFAFLITLGTIGFRMFIDGFLINHNSLIFSGLFIILLGLFIDYFLYFFYIKFKKTYFFKLSINKTEKIVITNDINFIRLF